MSAFVDLRKQFGVNWTTVLVGWRGLGVLSPWPDRWKEFPPLLSAEELADYALARLDANTDQEELDAASSLLALNLREERREVVCALLDCLSSLDKSDPALELRKWRLILLEHRLEALPNDPLYSLIALTEFWNDFGFPSDSPHEAQGVGNSLSPSEFYTQANLDRLLSRHQAWIRDERESIKKASPSFSTHPAS